MSFRLFVYWCALCGGWAAAGGWALGHALAHGDTLGATGIKGMFLGMTIALAWGPSMRLWVFSLRYCGSRASPRASSSASPSALSAASSAAWSGSSCTMKAAWLSFSSSAGCSPA